MGATLNLSENLKQAVAFWELKFLWNETIASAFCADSNAGDFADSAGSLAAAGT